jgi:hypothetical protein
MTEIRPIRADEAESFLRLLCEVFSLDFARARGIFFHEPLFDLHRKWALFHGGDIKSILTTVPLHFGWGTAIGIAGVGTRAGDRCCGYAGRLLDAVLQESRSAGENAAYLFARDPRLYAAHGFEVLDEAIYAPILGFSEETTEVLTFEQVRLLYDAWAAGSPERLRRTESRWDYWKWNLRSCHAFARGYVCLEGNLVREAVCWDASNSWPVGRDRTWFGLRSMASALSVPIGPAKPDLVLMGHSAPGIPQMFMTDQF